MSKALRKRTGVLDPADHVPTSTAYDHAVIDKFLRDARDKSELALNDHRAAAMTDRTDRLAGLILYFRHQVSFLNDLISQNQASQTGESSTRPGRRRRTDR